MLDVLTSEAFAEWFETLDQETAEEVATVLDVMERLGPSRAVPHSRDSLLWYEHPIAARWDASAFARDLEAWGSFREYAKRVLEVLESPRFAALLARMADEQVRAVMSCVRQIRKIADPRIRWGVKLAERERAIERRSGASSEDAHAQLRRLYLEALEKAGVTVEDVPAHSLALREVSRRERAPGFRLLYGVHAERGVALVVLGERLDRAFYGDSVRRAEAMWRRFLDGELKSVRPAMHR